MLLIHSCFSSLSHFRVFLGSYGYGSKKMHFGAFWSKIGLGMDSLCLEQKEWTKLKTKRVRIPNHKRIPNQMRNPSQRRFPTWRRKVKPRFPIFV